ncbi:olfactory receptor class A-like protein 1 [Rhinatrema bivittatum]|uniref:olfactory receptor class A-like protein 1 n=1 Tax=Rhinatrema bivittatum TaxID=194408 RepID=UPI00112D65A4|nr:olfactory receptor class A-like protein 1 [Rhinatrema bivittatum]
MDVRVVLKAIGFLLLEAIGIPGNLTVLACFVHIRIRNRRLLPADFITCKLSLVNLLVVLFRVVPQSLVALGLRKLFDDHGCNFVIFSYRVSRAMSICMTSLLSCYQCMLISPPSSFWATFKQAMVQKLFTIIAFLWCLNILIYFWSVFYHSADLRPNATAPILNLEFCFLNFPSYTSFLIIGITHSLRDFTFVGLMVLSSLHIIVILRRHRERVKAMRHTPDLENTAETRAANAVLMLVSLYVSLFSAENMVWLYSLTMPSIPATLSDTRVFLSSCYCTLSPIVIITTNKKVQSTLNLARYVKAPASQDTTLSYVHLGR